ncbi:FBD-associated F-box protein At4g10400 [Arachis duranensis]|uniref:FBD-associated F-box protein At4g10400 n=1 Tax=Arachis duranensis TaxID=130453 RepID=A0A9C6WLC4_ARADU|nr:FBD-associated F-box protein At4g10400 [Arachis duranensis]
MDRISGLPKGILHDILGRLPDKDAARTSVLSKAWRETWFSFPKLSCCCHNFFSLRGKLDRFIQYVSKRLTRLHDQGLAIKEFKLMLDHTLDYVPASCHIDQWIQMASESGVEVLELYLTGNFAKRHYNLPLCLTEAKSLTKLVLREGTRLDSALLNHSLKFFSLKTLSLRHILLEDERIIEHFISHCPLIEHLTLHSCYVYNNPSRSSTMTSLLKSLSLQGLQKLKDVDIQGIQEVYIDAPNLENLCYHAPYMVTPFKLNLDSCTNLRWLTLWNLKIPNKWFLEQFYRIPFLESLMLHSCSFEHERINIPSPELKFFSLSHCSNLKEVNIDAPNLLSCEYVGKDNPVISFLRISNQLELNAHYDMMPFSITEILGLSVLQVSSPPPSIKHVQLRFPMNMEARYFPLMNWLLSSCFPKTISFCLQSKFNMKAFVVFFYEMLMDRKKHGCYLRSWSKPCCWHGLKVVKATHLERTCENVEDLKAMLDALPESPVEEYITFGLEL